MALQNIICDKMSNKEILAFTHIPKAGGTTLIHIFRRNYFLENCDVRYLSKKSIGVFSAEDLCKTLLINPFIKCIMGHNIRPYSDLDKVFLNIRYVAVLRDPVDRFISHYLHRKMSQKENSFDEFMEEKRYHNYQTKFIAGSEDIDKAKYILAEKYFAVGVLEEFDEFLLLLSNKLNFRDFDTSYSKKRVRKDNKSKVILKAKYEKEIVDKNELDIELYEYVRKTIILKERAYYGPEFHRDLTNLNLKCETIKSRKIRLYIDYVLRKVYYEPVLTVIRAWNGLPPKGLPVD
jgi:hypothetical protein